MKSVLPDVVAAVAPNPPKLVPPKPVDAAVVVVLKPPNAGAGTDVAVAPKPLNERQYNSFDILTIFILLKTGFSL